MKQKASTKEGADEKVFRWCRVRWPKSTSFLWGTKKERRKRREKECVQMQPAVNVLVPPLLLSFLSQPRAAAVEPGCVQAPMKPVFQAGPVRLYLGWLHSCALSQELRVNSLQGAEPLHGQLCCSWNDAGQRDLTRERKFKGPVHGHGVCKGCCLIWTSLWPAVLVHAL